MNIPRNEVKRYLGYRDAEPDARTAELIETCCSEINSLMQCRSIWKPFSFDDISEGIALHDAGGFILPGQDIRRHLSGCHECVLMAATLGNLIERHLSALQVTDMTHALIFDCCATAAIEEYCDEIQAEVDCYAKEQGSVITFRYSPGYGDFPIDSQRSFVALLDAPRRIGLTASMEHLLIPRKSVTAVIGIAKEPPKEPRLSGCSQCQLRDRCPYGQTGCRGENKHV